MLAQLASVIDMPNCGLSAELTAKTMIRQYDPEWGGPVWYVP